MNPQRLDVKPIFTPENAAYFEQSVWWGDRFSYYTDEHDRILMDTGTGHDHLTFPLKPFVPIDLLKITEHPSLMQFGKMSDTDYIADNLAISNIYILVDNVSYKIKLQWPRALMNRDCFLFTAQPDIDFHTPDKTLKNMLISLTPVFHGGECVLDLGGIITMNHEPEVGFFTKILINLGLKRRPEYIKKFADFVGYDLNIQRINYGQPSL